MASHEPQRDSPGGVLSAKMSVLARRDTKPELELRRELHRQGLRYRVQSKVPGNRRRTIDIAFPRAQLAVYIDGCFWHGCPEHHVRPRANGDWWAWKIDRNRTRDMDTDHELRAAGWESLRIWEHEAVTTAAAKVVASYRERIAMLG